jgi:hypothetical protein
MENGSIIRRKVIIFERKIPRKICGPVYENILEWRIRYNKSL